ncbi:MAG: SH3 domain-containing protein, partial [Chloroflexota bacterium]
WSQRIWSVQRSSEGWRPMADRGSTTANHYDHVHVSVY